MKGKGKKEEKEMKLGVESVIKIMETVEAYARWSEALRLGCAEKSKRT